LREATAAFAFILYQPNSFYLVFATCGGGHGQILGDLKTFKNL
jgi:hypothetical protein